MSVLDILSNLPTIILYWDGLLLSWGIFIGLYMGKWSRPSCCPGLHRCTDRYAQVTAWCINAILCLFLFVVTGYDPGIMDGAVAINIFITCYYSYLTRILYKWYTHKYQPYHK